MTNIIGLLDLGRGALLTHQRSIHVTGHNIANAGTPGYTRQRVNLAAAPALSDSPGQMGSGVYATDIQRVHDRYIDAQLVSGKEALGRWQAQKDALEKAEMVFNEFEGYGLNQAMTDFFGAWHDLSNNPDGYVERVTLVNKAQYMTATFNRMSVDLQQQQLDLDVSIEGTVNEINRLAVQIADLNHSIAEIEINGENANDLRDQRAMGLQELAQMIDIDTYEDNDGRVSVLVGDGQPLVQITDAWQLSTRTNAAGHLDVLWQDRGGNTVDITAAIDGGNLKGWLEARDVILVDDLNRLDALAAGFMTNVNALHSAGFDLNADPGENFFNGITAADMTMNPNISANTDMIAASATAIGIPGDNSNALAIAGLQHALLMNGGNATFDDYYQSLVAATGNQVRAAADHHQHEATMSASLDNFRESVSGVSLDEEMLNLIKFQHAYDAAAKLIGTVDEMIDTVMNMTR